MSPFTFLKAHPLYGLDNHIAKYCPTSWILMATGAKRIFRIVLPWLLHLPFLSLLGSLPENYVASVLQLIEIFCVVQDVIMFVTNINSSPLNPLGTPLSSKPMKLDTTSQRE